MFLDVGAHVQVGLERVGDVQEVADVSSRDLGILKRDGYKDVLWRFTHWRQVPQVTGSNPIPAILSDEDKP